MGLSQFDEEQSDIVIGSVFRGVCGCDILVVVFRVAVSLDLIVPQFSLANGSCSRLDDEPPLLLADDWNACCRRRIEPSQCRGAGGGGQSAFGAPSTDGVSRSRLASLRIFPVDTKFSRIGSILSKIGSYDPFDDLRSSENVAHSSVDRIGGAGAFLDPLE